MFRTGAVVQQSAVLLKRWCYVMHLLQNDDDATSSTRRTECQVSHEGGLGNAALNLWIFGICGAEGRVSIYDDGHLSLHSGSCVP